MSYFKLYGLYSMDDLDTAAAMYKKPISLLSRIKSMISKGFLIPFSTISSTDCLLSIIFPFLSLAPTLYPVNPSGFAGGGVGDSCFDLPAATSIRPCFSFKSSGRVGKGEPLSSKGSTDDFLLNFLFNGSVFCFFDASLRVGLSLCFLWYSVK